MQMQIRNVNADTKANYECKYNIHLQVHIHVILMCILIYMPSLFVRFIDPTRRVPSSYYRLFSHVMTPLCLL